ncbi:hypothetical protein HAX54_047124 [Datura stramonium]|uniref:Cytochrome P450 n=1 Tax=Datura stramonium TaxID=4076 RepID=A0ABS8WJV8_DATST|nr:hypothetical protein [Datura stramonium]
MVINGSTKDKLQAMNLILRPWWFIETVVYREISDVWIPILATAAANKTLLLDDAVRLSFERLLIPFPFIWKIRRALDIGSEKKLRVAVEQVRKFAKEIVREKQGKTDLLSRFLSSTNGQPDEEDFVMDNAISFILAGRDTISAALTWFF